MSSAYPKRIRLCSFKKKVDANTKDDEGYTALHYAALHGHLDACKLLLRRGAHANVRDKRGSSECGLLIM